MHRIFKKEQILTIPNLLSLLRLLMIPLIVWLYCAKQWYTAAVGVIILSGLTDVADGIIARKFGLVSDFGKILDPLADKLTQGAVIISLATKYNLMIVLIIEFVLREIIMMILGYITIKRRDSVNSAKWYGKATTVLLYTVFVVLIFFPGISPKLANALIILCILMIIISLILYSRFYYSILREKK